MVTDGVTSGFLKALLLPIALPPAAGRPPFFPAPFAVPFALPLPFEGAVPAATLGSGCITRSKRSALVSHAIRECPRLISTSSRCDMPLCGRWHI
eukprot:TRINITY_DN30585_c0_g1_i1.p2 TRINITY_DN30585_c0_g1~~TRINITY_DN30585_c0_g1_i1.p2  ORF type:complete len:104 (-),score=6.56 TRINITY_DN30585_c0_g1_i1:26-310(-)